MKPSLSSFAKISSALGALCLAGAAFVAGAGPARAATPPYEPDPNSNGTLTFFNSSGAVVTSGSTTAKPFVAYVQASAAGHPSGDNKATLFGYLPKNGQATGAFAGEAMTGSTTYPVSSAPSALASSPLPLVALTPQDESIAELENNLPNTATDAYQGLYQLRVKTSGPGQSAGAVYEVADIFVNGSTWTQVYPAPASTTSSSTSSSTSSTSSSTTSSSTTSSTSTSTTSSTTSTTVAPVSSTTSTTAAASSSTLVVKNSAGVLPNNSTLTPGQTLSVSDSGFRAGESVSIVVNSTPQTLATTTASSSGVVTASVVLPSNLPAGAHTLVAAGTTKSDTFAFQVAAANSTSPLVRTGIEVMRLVAVGVLLLLAGLALRTLDRRRAHR